MLDLLVGPGLGLAANRVALHPPIPRRQRPMTSLLYVDRCQPSTLPVLPAGMLRGVAQRGVVHREGWCGMPAAARPADEKDDERTDDEHHDESCQHIARKP